MVHRRHESAAPVSRAVDDHVLAVLHHHEGGEVVVFRAQAVGHPAAERRPPRELDPRVHLADAAGVRDAVGPAGADHGQLVGLRGDVRQPVRHPQAAVAVLLPRAVGGEDRRIEFAHRRDDPLEARRHRLAGERRQRRLGVEQVDVTRPPLHVHRNHRRRLCRFRRLLRQQVILRPLQRRLGRSTQQTVTLHQGRQSERTESEGLLLKKVSS